jgi:hypothetical protein
METPELQRTRGWWVIWVWVVLHNIWAAGRRTEMLSQAARRHKVAHPVLVPAFALGMTAHLMGWLGHADPLWHLGELVERRLGHR